MEKNLANFRVALVSIAKNISLMIYNANCSAKENDILISNFSLYFIENTFWFRDSGISLGYHFKDE